MERGSKLHFPIGTRLADAERKPWVFARDEAQGRRSFRGTARRSKHVSMGVLAALNAAVGVGCGIFVVWTDYWGW
jgi:hypothetical protein